MGGLKIYKKKKDCTRVEIFNTTDLENHTQPNNDNRIERYICLIPKEINLCKLYTCFLQSIIII